MITENEGPLAPLVDLSLLKMKDRDRLHDVPPRPNPHPGGALTAP